MNMSPTKQKQYQHIVDTAKKLFLENGIQNIKISQIAKAASVDRKTFYNYFSNLEDVATAVLKSFQTNTSFDLSVDNANHFEQLKALLYKYFTFAKENPTFMLYSYNYDANFQSQPLFVGATTLKELQSSYLYQLVDKGILEGSINSHGYSTNKLIGIVFIPLISSIQKYYHRESTYQNIYNIELEDLKVNVDAILAYLKN